MLSKEFMKYLGGTEVKSELKKAHYETRQAAKSMFYLILKSSNNTPKKDDIICLTYLCINDFRV